MTSMVYRDKPYFLDEDDIALLRKYNAFFESLDQDESEEYNPKIKRTESFILKNEFKNTFPIEITKQKIQMLIKKNHNYELYKEHIYAINSPYLGIYNINFLDSDEEDIFAIFDIRKKDFYDMIQSIPEKFNTAKLTVLDLNHKVASNPYNLFTVYAIHSILTSKILSQSEQFYGCLSLLKLLHYKFFSSLIYRRFPFRPDEHVMRATIESLSLKFDLTKYGSWKKVIEQRSMDVLSDNSIHKKTLELFAPDHKILYTITDIQSRIREKVNLVTARFYDLKEKTERIGTYGMAETINGEKVLRNTTGSLDTIISRLSSDILSTSNFVDGISIKILTGRNKELKSTMFKTLLLRFVDISNFQNKNNKLDDFGTYDKKKIIIGHRALITLIIQTTYRLCIQNKVNMKNKYEILKATDNIFKNSQITNEDVLLIKRSVAYFVENFPGTKRINTMVALRSNFISYIILLSFRYI